MKRIILISILSLVVLITGGCRSASTRELSESPVSNPASQETPSPTSLSSGETPGTEVSQAEVLLAWEFAEQKSDLDWQPSNDLSQFDFENGDLATHSTGGDPFMNGPSTRLDALAAPHLEIRMSSSRGNDAQVFWEVDGQEFNESASQHFTVAPDGQWHTYRLDLKDHPSWRGTITRLRLDPSNQAGADLAIAWIRAIGPLPPELLVTTFGATTAIQVEGQPFDVALLLSNGGDLPADQANLRLALPEALMLVEGKIEQALSFDQQTEATWKLSGPAGVYPLGLFSGNQLLKTAVVVIESPSTSDILETQNGTARLRFSRQAYGYGIGTLETTKDSAWQAIGRMRSLGRVVYRTASGVEQEALFFAQEGSEKNGTLTFKASLTTLDQATLTEKVSIQPEEGKSWFNLEYVLTADQPVDLLSWSGPEFMAGEGASGVQLDGGLFPGLEFLSPGEQSSADDFVAPPGNLRYVPHPNKITLPLMSVTAQGFVSGLMWDPLQTWDGGAHDRPAALYAAPNTWENQSNHLMRLFVPGLTAGLAENHDRLETPFALAPGQGLRLSAALFSVPASDELSALEVYLEYSRLSEYLAREDAVVWPRSLTDEARLCLLSYTDATWDAAKKGWHYVLNDPWGPGSNPAVALHLWIGTLDDPVNFQDRTAIRRTVMSSLNSPPAGGQPNPWYYQPAFLLNTAGSLENLRSQLASPLALAAQQLPDGSWGFQPAGGTTPSFGSAGDTSNGYTATSAYQVLYFARLTGDQRLVAAGLKALDFLEAQPLHPEGAQTWELSLHVPDLLASSWVMQSFIEGYRLTGETRYLALAERWALSGLPFIYTWNPPDRPIMRYTTIPVFGASNYTSPWFGRPVMWNGLDYAIGLQNLAMEQAQAGVQPLLDWRRLAEGISSATAQMQPEQGSYAGMYPDAWDATTGAEAYTWWLSPTYLMQNLLLLQNNPYAQVKTSVVPVNGTSLRINSSSELLQVEARQQQITLHLQYKIGEVASIWVNGLPTLPRKVMVNGSTAKQESSWSGNGAGWDYQEGMLLIHVLFEDSPEAVIDVSY